MIISRSRQHVLTRLLYYSKSLKRRTHPKTSSEIINHHSWLSESSTVKSSPKTTGLPARKIKEYTDPLVFGILLALLLFVACASIFTIIRAQFPFLYCTGRRALSVTSTYQTLEERDSNICEIRLEENLPIAFEGPEPRTEITTSDRSSTDI
uniref:Uncharacterized protein n=1 Tax=Glyptapanteles flavicoxis TaxID=463051 RepID=B7S8D5_9HYME|nr:hypothetical protein GFP_L3_0210 [Glyptapanteles flavicoxis]